MLKISENTYRLNIVFQGWVFWEVWGFFCQTSLKLDLALKIQLKKNYLSYIYLDLEYYMASIK